MRRHATHQPPPSRIARFAVAALLALGLSGITNGFSTPLAYGQLFQRRPLAAPPLGEPLLLRAADRFQRLTDWHRRRPAAPGGAPA